MNEAIGAAVWSRGNYFASRNVNYVNFFAGIGFLVLALGFHVVCNQLLGFDWWLGIPGAERGDRVGIGIVVFVDVVIRDAIDLNQLHLSSILVSWAALWRAWRLISLLLLWSVFKL